MNTKNSLISPRRIMLALAGAGLLALPTLHATTEAQYDNHVDFGVGYNDVTHDVAGFQHALQQSGKGLGGIDDLFYTKSLNDTTTLTLKGRALFGSSDYLFDLNLAKDDVGYLKLGYKGYRVWFDGQGGYYPPNGFNVQLYDQDLSIDRGNFWFEAGYVPEGKVNFVFRYDLFTRKGDKDSTSWGDTSLTGGAGTRNLVPSFYQIDEKRHVVTATLSRETEGNSWDLGLRYDKGDYTNDRNEARAPGQSTSRVITQKEGRDYDLFMVHGSYVDRIHEKLMVTTAVATSKIDSTISGSRIYGPDYDPVFDPAVAGRQNHDEGFIALVGDTQMKQTVGTISALYQPTENWSFVPALRAENIDTDANAEFVETAVGSNLVTAQSDIGSVSNQSWKNLSESFEARYKGIKNVALNFNADLVQSTGDMNEIEVDDPGTATAATSLQRASDFKRHSQKYAASLHWYPTPGTALSAQYYYKGQQNDYSNTVDSTSNALTSGDRYPGYLAGQDFETNDFNVRLSWRLSSQVRAVTRYDYQDSNIKTQAFGLAPDESMKMKTHIISETLSFNPLTRWYVQSTVNCVWDTLSTPAADVKGAALNQVKDSDNNYVNFTVGTGYAISDGSNVYLDYSLYRAFNDYSNNSAQSVAFGTDARMQEIGLTWFHQLDRRTALTFRYAYAKNVDGTMGHLADYEAHLVSARVQYRF